MDHALNLQQLGKQLIEKRGGKGIREIAKEIGVSPATLSRVENGHLPDLNNFTKICDWLKVNPAEILNIKTHIDSTPTAIGHFRKNQTISASTAKSLAHLILNAQKMLVVEEEKGDL